MTNDINGSESNRLVKNETEVSKKIKGKEHEHINALASNNINKIKFEKNKRNKNEDRLKFNLEDADDHNIIVKLEDNHD